MALSRRRGRTRGATLVEYALLVALVIGGLGGAIRALEGASKDELDDQAHGINYDSPAKDRSHISLPAPPTTGSSTTTTAAPAPTTPTTTTTTTTAPTTTTTTTRPTTTTTAPPSGPGPTAMTLGSVKPAVSWWNGVEGRWGADVNFTYNWPIGASVTVRTTRHFADGRTTVVEERVWVGANASKAEPYLEHHPIAVSASNNVVAVDVQVVKIETHDLNWNSKSYTVTGPTIRVTAPPRPG